MAAGSRIKSANILYAIGVWGLLLGSVSVGFWAVLDPVFVNQNILRISTVVTVLAFCLPSAVYLVKPASAPLFRRFRFSSLRPSVFWIVPLALAGYFMFTGLNGLVMLLAESLGMDAAAEAAMTEAVINSGSMSTLVLLVGIVPAVCEEFLFRGILLPAYAQKSKTAAILISAALFAIAHDKLIGLPVLLLLGMVLGLIAWHSQSVLPAMLYHGLHNSISVISAKLSLSMASDPLYSEAMSELVSGSQLSDVMVTGTLVGMTIVGGLFFLLFGCIFLKQCKRHARPDEEREGRESELHFPARRPYLPLIIALAGIAALMTLQYWAL